MSAVSGQETLPPPTADADEVRRAADEILARPEFQEPPRSLYQRVLDWLGDLLGEVLGSLIGSGTGSVIAWLVLLVIVGGLAALVVRALQRNARLPGAAAAGADVIAADERRPPEEWVAEADRLEAEGRWRDALRCRYRALVATLAGKGVVEEVPGRTAGEYRTIVRHARPAAAEPFDGATDLFERSWYGNVETGPADASVFRALAERAAAEGASA